MLSATEGCYIPGMASRIAEGLVAWLASVTPGEVLVALASLLAVYFTLHFQRKDERRRIIHAILREVMEFCRLAVGHLETCENIQVGNVTILAGQFPATMRMPKAVIYPAIADRLGLLKNPTAVVTFFTRMSEVESMAALMAAQPLNPPVQDVRLIAEAWIDICEMGKCILMMERLPKRDVDRRALKAMLTQIERALQSARRRFVSQ